jgi:mutator protein MutT
LREIEVAAAVLERDGRFLIAQRPEGGHLAGYWEFPGGKRHRGESFEDCLRREILEELGVEVEVGDLLHETTHAYADRRVLLRFYRCRLAGGTPEPLDAVELRWVPAAGFQDYRFPPADEEILAILAAPPQGGR